MELISRTYKNRNIVSGIQKLHKQLAWKTLYENRKKNKKQLTN